MRKNGFFLFVILCVVAMGYTSIASSNGNYNKATTINPHDESTITIRFDGLMALCFGDPSKVTAGILDVHHHTPQVVISKIKGGQISTVGVISSEELRRTLYFDVEGQSTGISRYYAENDANDFGWTIDLESDIYNKKLYIKEEKLFGKVHFNSGLFYAGKQTDHAVRFFDNTGKALPFNRRIAQPAAKINLMLNEALIIRGKSELVRLVAEPGVRYEIDITNLPPQDMANMDHFLAYFDVVAAKVKPYEPVMVKQTAFSSGPVMCGVAVFSKSKLD